MCACTDSLAQLMYSTRACEVHIVHHHTPAQVPAQPAPLLLATEAELYSYAGAFPEAYLMVGFSEGAQVGKVWVVVLIIPLKPMACG